MMPLAIAPEDQILEVVRLGGSPEAKKRLEELGISVGGHLSIVSRSGDHVIHKVRESRIALGREWVNRVQVKEA